MFCTTDEVYCWLFNQTEAKPRKNFDRILGLVQSLGIKTDYEIIHIAGTNGKGSTAAYIKSILSLTGRHVGFFVSPYVISFNERIMINDRMISDAEIMHYANILYPLCEKYKEEHPCDMVPFFEITLLMALLYFQDRKIDLCVMECGIGGLLDATNFLKCDLAVITNIGYDHMRQLGRTLKEIAAHKLGIIKDGMHAITSVDESLIPQFEDYASLHDAQITYIKKEDVSSIVVSNGTDFIYKNEKYHSSLMGKFQAYNASLAVEAVKYVDPSIPHDIINYGLSHVFWPGRMEILQREPLVLLDGGHNISAVQASVEALKEMAGKRRISILFYALLDKDYPSMLGMLDSVAARFYFTNMEDRRKNNPDFFLPYITHEAEILPDTASALNKAMDDLGKDEILFITGSLHFVSLVREKYFKNFKED